MPQLLIDQAVVFQSSQYYGSWEQKNDYYVDIYLEQMAYSYIIVDILYRNIIWFLYCSFLVIIKPHTIIFLCRQTTTNNNKRLWKIPIFSYYYTLLFIRFSGSICGYGVVLVNSECLKATEVRRTLFLDEKTVTGVTQ